MLLFLFILDRDFGVLGHCDLEATHYFLEGSACSILTLKPVIFCKLVVGRHYQQDCQFSFHSLMLLFRLALRLFYRYFFSHSLEYQAGTINLSSSIVFHLQCSPNHSFLEGGNDRADKLLRQISITSSKLCLQLKVDYIGGYSVINMSFHLTSKINKNA